MAAATGLILILGPECCSDLPPAEGFIGVTVQHPDGGDGTQHEIDLYWLSPPGRREISYVSFDPLTVDGPIECPCGWNGTVANGLVVTAS